ncbi:MAG: hypothetical protein P0Y48_13310 [Candidatus Microbacterium phytovorans]|uniref:Uncharacterized protein n=1 Tax=Candidatus Microbacterium phytovorans TaxID=3121374 RepID=A0AAJ5W030_9MICO|nr:hypothetical protein [Microbacterium sp.]WEK13419.1 MAG: hypothetical protein P0Y48_13310 [Microbacterium sp.]
MANMWVVGPIVWIGLAVILGLTITFVIASRRARRTGDPSPLVSVTLSVSALWAAICVIAAAVVVLTTLLQGDIRIAVPVREFWPELPSGTVVEGPTAMRVGGGFVTAEIVATGLSTGVRVCWAIGQGLGILVPGVIATLLAVACFQLIAGRAFAPVIARMATVTAVVVAAGGIAAQMLSDIAGSIAAGELLMWESGQYEEVAGIEDVFRAWLPQPGFELTFPFWPLAAGLAFAALAVIFRQGARLQRDSEGLV